MTRPVRLADVARAAGVSLGTASNVFNRPDLVRPEVREAVAQVARDLGYSGPDPIGRLLMGGKANAIGVLPGGEMSVSFAVSSPYINSILFGIAQVCDEEGSSLVIVSGAPERKARAIRNALVDGFVLGSLDEIALVEALPRQVPFSLIDVEAGSAVRSVRVDGRAGARLQAEHLLALGHRRFAILATARAPVDAVWHPPSAAPRQLTGAFQLDEQKLAGYAEALGAAGIALDTVPMVEAFPPTPYVERGAALLLDKAPEATAILAMSDKAGLALVTEATARDIDVPGKLSVIGFDDVPTALMARPQLTTIAQDTREKGRIAAQMLYEPTPRQVILPVSLVLRGSTGPAAG